MTESTAIALPDPKEFAELGRLMHESGLFRDVRDVAQAAVKIMAGRELGLPPVASMRGIHIVEGKVELAGTAVAMLIRRSDRYDYRVPVNSDQACTVKFFAIAEGKREEIGETTWTLEDAARAGLCTITDEGKAYARSSSGKALPWETYTRAMLFNRAMSEGARTHVPDVFGGAVYAEGELADVDDSVPPPAKPVQQETSTPPDPEPAEETIAEGELVEEGAEEQSPDQMPAADAGEPEAEPAPSSSNGEADGEGQPSGGENPSADPTAADIPGLQERLAWTTGNVLRFARKHGITGADGKQVSHTKWEKLPPEQAALLASLLQDRLAGTHDCEKLGCEGSGS